MASDAPPPRSAVAAARLFSTFARLSLSGFGGVMPWVYAAVVEKERWLDAREFAELLAAGQILPGANVSNFAAMLGYRMRGSRGALAALAGLLAPGFLVTLAAGVLYRRCGSLPAIAGALRGIAAVAAGLIAVTGAKLLRGQGRKPRVWLFASASFLAVGVLGISLALTLAVLIPTALFSEWRAAA
jgi:chromate transporter